MNSLYAAIKFATPNNYYVSDISFGGEPEEAPPPAVLGNVSFLPESQVTAGFSGLTGIGVSDVSDLLNGVKSIHEFPELEYCVSDHISRCNNLQVPIKQSHRKVEDGIYYYDLPNGYVSRH
ncbi:hypothetical protein X943_001204 [Babesia divergens]|uniref:Uncharacterized protein n=1 Tax=Babesia divergens TaxID=32595 RepID=A0AAD9LE02_BABDI|nr:hypothetical protein X943_001204 [Babesia divergens]